MYSLYPELSPYQQHWLDVGQGHQLYLEESGNRLGLPVLVIHGGPGSGCSPILRRFFDPQRYRIILFDQRGCGQSRASHVLTENHSQALVEDMERIRLHLGIEQWLLWGGSWGSALALYYGQLHPRQILGFILRGIFLARPQDIAWNYQAGNGASRLYPSLWHELCQGQPLLDDSLLATYQQRLHSSNELEQMQAARLWWRWMEREQHHQLPQPHPELLNRSRIHCHYLTQQCFLQQHPLLEHMTDLAQHPAILIQGELDTICPAEQAWQLYQHWPSAELHWVKGGRHSPLEPSMVDNLIRASRHFALRSA